MPRDVGEYCWLSDQPLRPKQDPDLYDEQLKSQAWLAESVKLCHHLPSVIVSLLSYITENRVT